jgi:hypothetical protein
MMTEDERSYLYQLIRYVPDLRRMEPQNIGVIVQGWGGITCRIWTRFRPGENYDFDYVNFRRWREFFEAEINGPQIAMFQPLRTTPEFLDYLQLRAKRNYMVTAPLQIGMDTNDLESVKDYLYSELVRATNDDEEPAEQPVTRLKDRMREKKLHLHPRLRRDEYVKLNGDQSELFRWNYDLNHGSNRRVLIDTVQWLGRIRYTQFELEHVLTAAEKLTKSEFPAEFVVVMDQLDQPSSFAKDERRYLYENYVRGKERLQQLPNAKVVSSATESESLVSRIEQDLRQLVA